MTSTNWKFRLMIYLLMKMIYPTKPGWLVVAEQAWQLQNTILRSGFVPQSSPFVESSWQYTLTILKSVHRFCRYSLVPSCSWSTRPSTTNKISAIDKDYAFICTKEKDAIQAVREHGKEQEVLCLRERAQWPAQAYSLRR